jgi:LL-diaminopimelate aminotransferase
MMKPKSRRMQDLTPQFFASLGEKINTLRASGVDVINLDIGSPDMPPATHVIEAMVNAVRQPGLHGYQSHHGTMALRQAWATYYQREHLVDLDPERQILQVLGSKEGIFHLSTALVDEGDIVLIPDPGYVTYTHGTLFAGGTPYYLPLQPQNGWLPDLDHIPEDALRRAKILWLNYPNNPTTATASLDFFAKAVSLAKAYDLVVCHDAAYTQITYDDYRSPSILEVPGAMDVAVEFNTLSKTYNMAGWRVGVAAGNAEVLSTLYSLKTRVDSGHFLPVWQGAIAALTGDQSWVVQRNEIYKARRDLVVSRIKRLGLGAQTPQASFYIWARIPDGFASMRFTNELLEATGVSITPGTVFGECGEGYVRITLCTPEERIQQALDRMERWMGA